MTTKFKDKFAEGAQAMKAKFPTSYVNINLSETAENLAQAAREFADNATVKMNQAKEGFQDMAQSASIKASQAKETLTETLGTAYIQGGEALNSARDTVLLGKEKFLENFWSAKDRVAGMAEDGKSFYNEFSISMSQNLENLGEMAHENIGTKLAKIFENVSYVINIKWKEEPDNLFA